MRRRLAAAFHFSRFAMPCCTGTLKRNNKDEKKKKQERKKEKEKP
jgi:hypothetical protein